MCPPFSVLIYFALPSILLRTEVTHDARERCERCRDSGGRARRSPAGGLGVGGVGRLLPGERRATPRNPVGDGGRADAGGAGTRRRLTPLVATRRVVRRGTP